MDSNDILKQRIIQEYNNKRDPFERDRARIIHSASFRRLQAKTQVLGISDGDFHRTRLTHSMEVAQIAQGIGNTLKKNNNSDFLPSNFLLEAIGLAHDLGHPPFGHDGEAVLDYMMKNNGGFEGNAQTLRIISKLESYEEDHGLNLTRRTLLGILKYPIKYNDCLLNQNKRNDKFNSYWKPPKCYFDSEQDIVDWILKDFSQNDRDIFIEFENNNNSKYNKAKYKALDTSILDLADDIAYGVHDLEDGIALKLISKEDFENIKNTLNSFADHIKSNKDKIIDNLFSEDRCKRKKIISKLINYFIENITLKQHNIFENDLLKNSTELEKNARKLLDELQDLSTNKMIKIHSVTTLAYRGQHIVKKLFEAISLEPKNLLPENYYKLYDKEENKLRIVCDYISGMTDNYATRIYERLFIPRQGSIFERL